MPTEADMRAAYEALVKWGEHVLRADAPMGDAEDREWRMDLGDIMRSTAALARRLAVDARIARALAALDGGCDG